MMVARRIPGPAYANLQGRKPWEVWRGCASDAMGISALAVCCGAASDARWGGERGGDEPGRPIAIGRTGGAQRRSNGKTAIQGGTRASVVIAGREPAKQKCSPAILPGAELDHDVSILMTAVHAAGRERGEAPRWNVSMMIMRPPQHGHRCASGLGSLASAQLVSPASGCAAGTSSKRRARAMLSARAPLASNP